MIEVKSEFVEVESRSNNTRTRERREIVWDEELKRIRAAMEAVNRESLPENAQVYFDTKVVFPRRKFQQRYKGCKLVSDLKKADVVVLDWTEFLFPVPVLPV
jgi:Holliday junction resolvase-like predicted endonuclease